MYFAPETVINESNNHVCHVTMTTDAWFGKNNNDPYNQISLSNINLRL